MWTDQESIYIPGKYEGTGPDKNVWLGRLATTLDRPVYNISGEITAARPRIATIHTHGFGRYDGRGMAFYVFQFSYRSSGPFRLVTILGSDATITDHYSEVLHLSDTNFFGAWQSNPSLAQTCFICYIEATQGARTVVYENSGNI